MIEPRLTRKEDGGLLFEELAPWFVGVLGELPALLDDERPQAVRERLFPWPSEDEETREEWRRYVHPELFALLASAREIVKRDLENLEPADPDDPLVGWRLPIPDDHVQAWIGALNAARLNLAAVHDIGEEEMQARYDLSEEQEEDPDLPPLDKLVAIEKIGLLAWLQAMIIDDVSPPPEDFRGQEGYPDTGE